MSSGRSPAHNARCSPRLLSNGWIANTATLTKAAAAAISPVPKLKYRRRKGARRSSLHMRPLIVAGGFGPAGNGPGVVEVGADDRRAGNDEHRSQRMGRDDVVNDRLQPAHLCFGEERDPGRELVAPVGVGGNIGTEDEQFALQPQE